MTSNSHLINNDRFTYEGGVPRGTVCTCCVASRCLVLSWVVLRCLVLCCFVFSYVVLCVVLRCFRLVYITLHYITLQCISSIMTLYIYIYCVCACPPPVPGTLFKLSKALNRSVLALFYLTERLRKETIALHAPNNSQGRRGWGYNEWLARTWTVHPVASNMWYHHTDSWITKA